MIKSNHPKPNLIFKYLSDADKSVEHVWRLISDNYASFGYVCPNTLKNIEGWVQHNESDPVFVAYKVSPQEGNPAEFVGFIYVTNEGNFRAEIGYMVYVNYRQMGIGTAMIEYAEKYIREYMQVEHITANVYKSEESSKLLLKNGFQHCGTITSWCKVFINDKPDILDKKMYYKNLK
jgi:RimJ/RimL family protein N-acetyltransferase